MKQILLCILFTCFFTATNAQEETMQLSDFNKLSVTTNIKMELIKSDETKMEIEIIKGDRSELKIEENGKHLKVYIKGKNKWGGSKTKAKLKLYFTELDDISVGASARVFSDDVIKSDDFDADVSSSGSLNLSVEANSLDSDISSSATLEIKGACNSVDINVSSSGSFKGAYLKTKTADLNATSSGSIKIWVTESIEANTSSSGSIKYKGSPSIKDIDRSISGGSIKSIDNN